MKQTWGRVWQVTLVLLVTALVGAADTSNNNPPPGTLNYVEGQVSVQGQKQSQNSVGTTYLNSNQVLETSNGNAEILLTPGVFMRVGNNSEMKMISPGLADTRVQLTRGSAMMEVDELFKENDISVVVDGATTRIEKKGLYDFTADHPAVKVLGGKAIVSEGNQRVKLTKGHEVLLSEGQPLARQSFNKDHVEEDPLYRFSKLRSDYATQSNVDAANDLLMDGGWWGPGWYWDPFWWDFAFMPGFGIGWGPFGYPFFSPWAVGYSPYYGFGYRGGYGGYGGGHGVYNRTAGGQGRGLPPLAHQPKEGTAGFRALPRSMAANRMGDDFRGGGFRGGSTGGFHSGGMGGFHGGIGGGRR